MKVSHEDAPAEGGFADLVARVREAIRRRWITLTAVTVTLFALGIALIMMMTPQYTATANVRIDPSRTPTAGQNNDAADLTPEAIETEVALIQSPQVATRVVEKLNLVNDPEFTKGIGDVAPGADRTMAVITNVMRKFSVSRNKLSYILGIQFTSRDRTKAAAIANAFADAYLYEKVGTKTNSANRKAEFLQKQLTDLGNEIRGKEAQVANYQAAAGIVEGSGTSGSSSGTITDQQIAPLSSQLAMARSDAAAANADLGAARRQAARGGDDTVSDVLASPVIGQLRAQRAEVVRGLGEALSRYGERHPDVVKARSQLNDIDAQIRGETRRIIESLRSKADAANARVESLQGSMNGLATRQAGDARNAVLATSLKAEIDAQRTQYDKLSQATLDSVQAANNSIAQAEIVSRATPPLKPSKPNKMLLGALALLVALAGGTATIAIQELMAAGLRSAEDIMRVLGVPMLAAVPRVRTDRPADLLIDKPSSLFGESLRIARASILGVRSENPPRVMAITSALPGEGKTTTALAFARTLAINGQKTLIIDCDVRRAMMREIVSNPSGGAGLIEVLQGSAAIDQAITPGGGGVDNLDVLLVRETFFNSGNLFGDGKMKAIIAAVRPRYDAVVLDLPPLLGLADGRFLAAMADVVALVIRWDSTPAQAASAAMSALEADGANVAGAIFTMVDTGAEAIGGLYYSKKYTSYYRND